MGAGEWKWSEECKARMQRVLWRQLDFPFIYFFSGPLTLFFTPSELRYGTRAFRGLIFLTVAFYDLPWLSTMPLSGLENRARTLSSRGSGNWPSAGRRTKRGGWQSTLQCAHCEHIKFHIALPSSRKASVFIKNLWPWQILMLITALIPEFI